MQACGLVCAFPEKVREPGGRHRDILHQPRIETRTRLFQSVSISIQILGDNGIPSDNKILFQITNWLPYIPHT